MRRRRRAPRCSRPAAAAAREQDAGEAKRTLQDRKSLDATFPAEQSIARPATHAHHGAQRGRQDDPERRGHASTPSTTPKTIPNWPPTSARCGSSNGARERRPAGPCRARRSARPGGGQTAYVNTWALGPLAPGRTQTFGWQVVPVKAGAHTVHYRGRRRARRARPGRRWPAAAGRRRRSFDVSIAPAPPLDARRPEHRQGRSRALPGAALGARRSP